YPFWGLSGSAVAFKVAWALCQKFCGGERVGARHREVLLDAGGLAALGIVADVVPLHDENRILGRHGLVRLQQSPSMGLRALMESSGLTAGGEVRASDIGFKLGPRLNAAGRLGCARLVVELLTTTSPQKAFDLAQFLDKQNQDRQKLERRIAGEAREQVAAHALGETPALVLTSPDWHAGVIGIVAGRLAESYGRPVLLIAQRRERPEDAAADPADGALIGQGSGRSIPGFPLHEALEACGEHLLSHGGHQAAAGFKILPERIDAFRASFCAFAAAHFPSGPPAPRLVIDA